MKTFYSYPRCIVVLKGLVELLKILNTYGTHTQYWVKIRRNWITVCINNYSYIFSHKYVHTVNRFTNWNAFRFASHSKQFIARILQSNGNESEIAIHINHTHMHRSRRTKYSSKLTEMRSHTHSSTRSTQLHFNCIQITCKCCPAN